MHISAFPLILLFLCTTACKESEQKSGVPFKVGIDLSSAEKASLVRIDPELTYWRPDYRATWDRNGLVRHVCLHGMIGSIVWPYEVVIFDGNGVVMDANIIDAPSGHTPKALLGISPLKILFAGFKAGEKSTVVGFRYPPEQGLRELRRLYEHSTEMRRTIEEWKRSGNTNVTTLNKMLKEIRLGNTNSTP